MPLTVRLFEELLSFMFALPLLFALVLAFGLAFCSVFEHLPEFEDGSDITVGK